MTDFSYVMTILFLLVGPVKIIPAFAKYTRGADGSYKRQAALLATLFASIICGIIVLMTANLVAKYQLSIPALQITGGLILLLSALRSIFPIVEPAPDAETRPGAARLALAPLASPVVVTPAGVAALMVFVLLAQAEPVGLAPIVRALAIVMALNLVVMLFNDLILKVPGLGLVLQLLGTVLIVVQVALAVQAFLFALARLGLVERV